MFEARRHGNYALFFDADNPQLDPLSLFIFPQYRMIAGLIDDYDNIAVLGISGGGWYVVWLAALMPEIDQSISYAGSLAPPYHQFGWNHGDWEQTYSAVYSTVSYIELYQLMTLGDGENRPAYLVYNSDDPCTVSETPTRPGQAGFRGRSRFELRGVDRAERHAFHECRTGQGLLEGD